MYGAGVLSLPSGEKLALLANIPTVLANRVLDSGKTSHLTTESYRQLVLAATGSKKAAEEATRQRLAAQMRAGITPT